MPSGDVVAESRQTEGGINFNAAMLGLQIKRDGNGVPLPIAGQQIKNISVTGFYPVILDVQPANLPALLGSSG